MADCDLAETRRNRIHPCCCICGYREVLTPRTLRCRADVVRAGDGILDHQIGAVDERRLDLPTQVIELRTFTPTELTSGLTARSTFVGPWPLKPARMSWLPVVTNSCSVASADASGGLAARSAAPSFLLIMTAGRSSPPNPSLAMPIGSPATLLITTTPTAPAAIALRTFVLNVQVPRSTIASLPEAPGSTLVQAVLCVSKRSYDAVGRGGNSPTAAPIVVPPPSGYVNSCPTKCWFVLAATVMTLRARPGDSTVPCPGPLLPAATATTTPASAALSRPIASRSLLPW